MLNVLILFLKMIRKLEERSNTFISSFDLGLRLDSPISCPPVFHGVQFLTQQL